MNFILRGILTLKAKLGRSLMLLCIMLVVCVVVLSSFGIQSATDAAAILARQKLGANVVLTQNMEKQMQEQRENMKPGGFKVERKTIPLEYVDELKDNEHVTGYLITNTTHANLIELTAVGATESESDAATSENVNTMGNMRPPMNMGDISLEGINEFEFSSEYIDGNAVLIDGREIIESDKGTNVVMVEENFATLNNLSIGSKFKIYTSSEEENVELEVVGIYKTYSTVDEGGFKSNAMSPYNKIYAPYTLINSVNGSELSADSVTFYLDDPINVDSFIEYGKNTSIDFETYTLDAGARQFESMMQPIENVASFSKIMIVIVSLFGAAILALIIMLSIKDRINEIGILMSLGEKRIKIIGQFLVEVFVILAVALTISIAMGNTISNNIGDVLLQNEIKTESQENIDFQGGMGRPTGGNRPGGFNQITVEKIDEMNVDISMNDIGKMSALAVLIAIIGTILPSLLIMRYNPKQILSKHN